MPHAGNISDFYPQWKVHGSWPCGHVAPIDLGRFIAWGMQDVPMVPLCKRLRCPKCGERGPAEIATGWLGPDTHHWDEVQGKVRTLKPRSPK